MENRAKKVYALSLTILSLLSAYPLYMGFSTFLHYRQNGFISASDYQKYIIPYTPLCIAILVSTALLPLLFKWLKKATLPGATLIGLVTFILSERWLEQIKVVEDTEALPLDSWQYSLCVATPQVLKSIGEPLYAQNNPAFKVHFYLIALVILLAVLNVVYGFMMMYSQRLFDRKRPLMVQLIAVLLFVGLCVLACFTAFFRTGQMVVSPLSAFLMSVFFIAFGVTLGVYFGCLLYEKSHFLSIIFPSMVSMLMTAAMYAGEVVLMGGTLYRYGYGFLFEPIGVGPLSAMDLMIIILSGGVTCFIMKGLHGKKSAQIDQESGRKTA